ncbi:MAG TPA: hypothetical protein PK723_05105 [Candidatus Pacearchaeota archaeon]|nr:hypothetical protein [Candidatus Pacearchaeota archaeon]
MILGSKEALKEIDERFIINKVVTKMIAGGGEPIETHFNNLNIDLSKEEIIKIIRNTGYNVLYNPKKRLYKIWKDKKTNIDTNNKNSLRDCLRELKESGYMEKHDQKLLELENYGLYLDEAAIIIRDSGFSYYFNNVHSVWIL